jgi:hypothetical protein
MVLMRTRMEHAAVIVWIARLLWVVQPLTTGALAADALDGWATAPGLVAAVALWLAWGAGLLALLAPRPIGLTALRAIAPGFAALAIVAVCTSDESAVLRALAVVSTVSALVAVLQPAVSVACANGASYGDERRHPLKVPPVLFLGPLPLAPFVIGAGLAAGPILLADGRVVAGIVALLGLVPAALAARSLHTLAQRFAVLVPAGIAVVDPFTLPDPVMFPRERITALRLVHDRTARPRDEALDLRTGATGGSVALTLDKVTDALQVRRARRGATTVRADELWFAAVAARDLVRTAGERRIRVG